MVTTVFSDEIVNASELRTKQRHWLSMAAKRPVTVTDGSNRLTIYNREKIRDLFIQKYYSELFIKYCNEFLEKDKNRTIPWLQYLDESEQKQFHKEFLTSVISAIVTDNWDQVEVVLADWKATAETENDPEAMKALQRKGRKSEYIALK